jgi:hypothetical protein
MSTAADDDRIEIGSRGTADAGGGAPVGRLTGDEVVPPGVAGPEARSAARQWFDTHLRRLAIRSAALGRDVGFNRVSREKFISQAADRR